MKYLATVTTYIHEWVLDLWLEGTMDLEAMVVEELYLDMVSVVDQMEQVAGKVTRI